LQVQEMPCIRLLLPGFASSVFSLDLEYEQDILQRFYDF
jgi:hypothetical protein